MAVDTDKLNNILTKYQGESDMLIQALLEVQHEFNWIPGDAIPAIASTLNVPRVRIHRIASYYKAMSLKPKGKHTIRVCMGTACHVRRSAKIMDHTQEILGFSGDGNTPDLKFTLERVNCLGCCALGPVIAVDKDYYSNPSAEKLKQIFSSYD